MGSILVLVFFVALVGVVVALVRKARQRAGRVSSERLPYARRDYLMSRAERSLYGVLEQATAGEYRIFSKVRLADLIAVRGGTAQRQAHFNRISAKHVDFVLCSRDAVSPLLVLELDDASHNRPDRARRDGFVDDALASAGLPILHLRARSAYDAHEIADAIRRAMAPGEERDRQPAAVKSR
jgi:hypothetical protein